MFVEAFKELWLPILTICFILAISKITTYGGLSAAMGQGIAKAGGVFPILSPILGWIGVFMTGSVVNNNSLFAPIQASVAQQIGTSAPLLVERILLVVWLQNLYLHNQLRLQQQL